MELAPYMYTPKTTIYQQKELTKMFRFKMAAKKQILVSQKKSYDQNLKNYFPKGSFR